MVEVKDLLKERLDMNEKGIEPTYEQNLAIDYSKKFSKLTPAKARKLLDEIKDIEGFNELIAIKVVDILPEDLDELNLLIPRQQKIEEDKLKQALELVTKFRT